ncbi:MAG: aldo/keto reductase [Opitutaceae bacterium]|nr:aldo/keto reductase [Opitutaceae bacterium]
MNKRKFGRTGLEVSEICLGTMHFGWKIDERSSFEILNAFRDAGGNFIQSVKIWPDSTSAARPWVDLPFSQVGRWLRMNAVPRDQWILATRVSLQPIAGSRLLKPEAIRECCEATLRQLQTDRLDLVVLNWTDCVQNPEDVFSALTSLVRAGKLRYFGAANFPAWRIMETLCHSIQHGSCRPETFQSDYSLLDRSFEGELTEIGVGYRLSFLASAPLASGYLTGRQVLWESVAAERHDRLRKRYDNARGQSVMAQVQALASQRGVPPAQVALAWVLANPHVTSSIVGVNTISHLQDAVAATRLRLSEEEMGLLDLASRIPPDRAAHGQDKPAKTPAAPQRNLIGQPAFS